MNGPDELGPPPTGKPQPPTAGGPAMQRRRASRRRRRITLASVGAVVGIAVGLATIWQLLTGPDPTQPPPPIVADLKTMHDQAKKLGRIRAAIELDVKGVLAGNVTRANAANDIAAHNEHRREVVQTLRVLSDGQKNVPSLAAQLSKIAVLEQKTATAYVACFQAGQATCPSARFFRIQQGKLKTNFAINFDTFVAKHPQWEIEDLSASEI